MSPRASKRARGESVLSLPGCGSDPGRATGETNWTEAERVDEESGSALRARFLRGGVRLLILQQATRGPVYGHRHEELSGEFYCECDGIGLGLHAFSEPLGRGAPLSRSFCHQAKCLETELLKEGVEHERGSKEGL